MELIRERLKIEEYNYPFADKVKSQLQSQITLLSASGPSNINAQFTGWELQGKEVDNIIKWIGNLITKDFVPDGGFTLKCSELECHKDPSFCPTFTPNPNIPWTVFGTV